MSTPRFTQVYGIRPRMIYNAIGSGELFVACGADRRTVDVDFRPGGTFTTSALSGDYTEVTPDAVTLTSAVGSVVTLTVGGTESRGSLTVEADDVAWWQSRLPALAPPGDRLSAEGDERILYDDYLDYYRGAIPAKLVGLSEADARRPIVGSKTTLLGLAKHLTGVERNWFAVLLDRRSREEVGPNNRGSDESWDLTDAETIDSVLADYDDACAQSRRIATRYELTDIVPDAYGNDVSLRTIYIHMIEEIARHAGHADILRELTDGATG